MAHKQANAVESHASTREPVIRKISRTGSWDRAVVFDQESGKVDIRKRQDVEKDFSTGDASYEKLDIPKRRKSISLFLGKNDGTKLKTDETRSENDKFLVRLSLDHLGLVNRALLTLGFVTTLYVSVASQSTTFVK